MTGDFRHSDLAFGRGGSTKIENEWTLFAAGTPQAKWIDSESRSDAAHRRDTLRASMIIRENQRKHARLCSAFRVFPQTANMRTVP